VSADKYDNIVSKLVADAERTNDPVKLAGIVERMRQQGAWREADHVQLKVREIERRYAEAAQR
jgi:hypothetical protein